MQNKAMVFEKPNTSTSSSVLTVARLLLSAHFLVELYDKFARFSYWYTVIKAAGQPWPLLELIMIVVLLLYGAPHLLVGKRVPSAVAALIIFQVPTTFLFETTSYEKFDSVSVIGGLLLASQIDWSKSSASPQKSVPFVGGGGLFEV